ncbi:MAG: iron chelate uptake ABC transporter family permease subunit, partial [Halapricum sp.]
MRTHQRTVVWSSGLVVALVGVVLASATVGPASVPFGEVLRATLDAIGVPTSLSISTGTGSLAGLAVPVPTVSIGYTYLFSFSVPRTSEIIVREIRLPRIVLGAVVGFALGGAGAVMQGFFRNPMADPSIIGVSTGAAVGAVATIALPLAIPFGLQTAAFVGAVATAFVVYLLATEHGRTPVATLLLAGVAVQTFLGAVVSFLLLQSGESLERALYWLMGHLYGSSWGEVQVTLPVVAVLFLALLPFARDLNVLMLGEEDARTLGIPVEWT